MNWLEPSDSVVSGFLTVRQRELNFFFFFVEWLCLLSVAIYLQAVEQQGQVYEWFGFYSRKSRCKWMTSDSASLAL